jgi:hypothetical protein
MKTMGTVLHRRKGDSTRTVEERTVTRVEEGTTVATGGGRTVDVRITVLVPAGGTLLSTLGGAGEGYLKSQTTDIYRKGQVVMQSEEK